MSRKRTRLQLRNRAKREAHRTVDTGAFNDASWNASLADGWALAWHIMTHSEDDSFGRATRELTATVDSDTMLLPDAFAELITLYRLDGTDRPREPKRVTADYANRQGWFDGRPPTIRETAYYLDGPGIEFVESLGQEVDYDQRIRIFPTLKTGETLRVVYRSHEPSLGDPDDEADDTTTIDIIWEPIERSVIGYARSVAANREDPKEMKRAQDAMRTAVGDAIESRGRRNKASSWGIDVFQGGGAR